MATKANCLMLIMKNDEQFIHELGERIRGLRKAQHITQAELAERLGVTQALIASYESARRSVPLRKLIQLAEILGVSIEEIVGQPELHRQKPGPASKLEQKIMALERLPRSEQLFVLRMLDSALAQAQ